MNTGILYARMMVTVFLSLYTTRILLDSLGSEDFGIFALVGGVIAMLGFLNASMSAASQRFMSYAHGQGDLHKQVQIFNASCLLHIFIAIIMVVALEAAGLFFLNGFLNIDQERMAAARFVYHTAVLSVFFAILSAPYDAVITARENMLFFAVLSTIESLCKLAIALFVSYTMADKLMVYGLSMAGLMFILFCIKISFCHYRYRECKFSPVQHFSKPLFKELTSFGGWSLLGTASAMIANFGQGIVLNKFFGTSVNAAQGVAVQLNGQISSLAITMQRAINPMIIKSEGAGSRSSMLTASMVGSKAGFFLLLILCMPAIIEMPYLLSLWLVDVPEYAVLFCQLLLLRGLIEQLFVTIFTSIRAVGDIKRLQIVTSSLSLLPLTLSCVLFYYSLPPWWMYVVFIAHSFILCVVVLYFAVIKCGFNIKEYLSNVVARCCAVFVLLGFVLVLISSVLSPSLINFCIFLFFSFSFTTVLIWFIGLSFRERSIIKSGLVLVISKVLNMCGKVL